MAKSTKDCCFYCDETKFKNRAEAMASLKGTDHSNQSKSCHSLGPITRNPFFNFMRHLRETSCSHSIIDMAKHAGAEWRKMSDQDKCPFVMAAHRAPRRSRRHLRLDHSNMSMNSTSRYNSTLKNKAAKRLKTNRSAMNSTRDKRSKSSNHSMGSMSGMKNISAIKKSPR